MLIVIKSVALAQFKTKEDEASLVDQEKKSVAERRRDAKEKIIKGLLG